jgi:hypothetical protein
MAATLVEAGHLHDDEAHVELEVLEPPRPAVSQRVHAAVVAAVNGE